MRKNVLAIVGILVAAVAAITLTIIFLPKNEEGPSKVNNVTKKEFDIESESLESFKFMKRMDESNLFYLGLDAVSIDGTDMLEYLRSNDIAELKKNFNKVETYKDGGSQLYTCDDDKKCDTDIKALFCNTTTGDKDVYLAHKDIDLNAEYCDNTPKDDENQEEE